jgi:hypothetical protein
MACDDDFDKLNNPLMALTPTLRFTCILARRISIGKYRYGIFP